MLFFRKRFYNGEEITRTILCRVILKAEGLLLEFRRVLKLIVALCSATRRHLNGQPCRERRGNYYLMMLK